MDKSQQMKSTNDERFTLKGLTILRLNAKDITVTLPPDSRLECGITIYCAS